MIDWQRATANDYIPPDSRGLVELHLGGAGIHRHHRCGAYVGACSSRDRTESRIPVSLRLSGVADGHWLKHDPYLGLGGRNTLTNVVACQI